MTYIVNIFEVVNESLLTFQYEDDETDAFTDLFERWSDVEYLEEYFESNKHQLNNQYWGGISVEDAVLTTLEQAVEFENRIIESAQTTDDDENLEVNVFKPIGKKNVTREHIMSKSYGGHNSWLRLYAIRVDYNLYVVTGGGIKLVESMAEDELLTKELDKMKCAIDYLKELGFDSKKDYDFVEIKKRL